jgi:hypothetical protein
LIADAGTPLMWASFLHLTVGNLFIGLLEAAIVRWCFGVRAGARMITSIILGNYVSCIAGYLLIFAFSERLVAWIGGAFPVYSIWRIMIVLAAASFVVTILIEWPFFWFGMSRRPVSMRRSLNVTLLANAASYLILLGWYWLASATPMQWGVKLVRANELSPIPDARVFYISPDGNDVMQMRLDGSPPVRLCPLQVPDPYGSLGFTETAKSHSWELQIQHDSYDLIHKIAEIGPGRAASRPSDSDWCFRIGYDFDDLQEPSVRKWKVWIGNWPALGIRAENDQTGFPIMAVEMPWLGWLSCNATILPNDQLVFQLGEQIMRVDLLRKVAAAVAAGHGPVVVLDEK